jgi:hypothetical protein
MFEQITAEEVAMWMTLIFFAGVVCGMWLAHSSKATE